MHVQTLEINWHDQQAVYSLDFESVILPPQGPDGRYRLASAGADSHVRIWELTAKTESKAEDSVELDTPQPRTKVQVSFLSELKRHTGPVNVVRWHPKGGVLASAGDDATLIIWERSDPGQGSSTFGEDTSANIETYRVNQMLLGHRNEIYDLAWSPDGRYLITGSIDNTARLWDWTTRQCIHVFTNHSHYVQGVCWDPLAEFVATQSSDRSLQVHSYTTSSTAKESITIKSMPRQIKIAANKARAAIGNGNSVSIEKAAAVSKPSNVAKSFRLYQDENLLSFFRRLTFTPDGAFLISPAGIWTNSVLEPKSDKENVEPASTGDNTNEGIKETQRQVNTVYIFGRNGLDKPPIAHLPNHRKPPIAVRCNPIKYTLPQSSDTLPLYTLPYRYLYSVATLDALIIYDTQSTTPTCFLSGLHYSSLTDMAWSPDGSTLIVSSTDGYCSVLYFAPSERLEPCEPVPIPQQQTTPLSSASSTSTKPASVIPPSIASPAPVVKQKKRIVPTFVSALK